MSKEASSLSEEQISTIDSFNFNPLSAVNNASAIGTALGFVDSYPTDEASSLNEFRFGPNPNNDGKLGTPGYYEQQRQLYNQGAQPDLRNDAFKHELASALWVYWGGPLGAF